MPENDSLLSQKRNLFVLERLLKGKKIDIEEIANFLPGMLHVNSMEDASLIFISKKGCDFLSIERTEIMSYSAEQLSSIVTEDTLRYIIPRFIDFYKRQDINKAFAQFQQIKNRNKKGYRWVYTTTKIYTPLNASISLSIPIEKLDTAPSRLVRFLEEDLFAKKNFHKFDSLSEREKEIISRIVLGERRRDIADKLNISVHTYDTHKKNIRKKLEIHTVAELVRFALAFGLVEF